MSDRNIRAAIMATKNEDPAAVGTAIENELNLRVAAAIDDEKISVAQNMFDFEDEDFEDFEDDEEYEEDAMEESTPEEREAKRKRKIKTDNQHDRRRRAKLQVAPFTKKQKELNKRERDARKGQTYTYQ